MTIDQLEDMVRPLLSRIAQEGTVALVVVLDDGTALEYALYTNLHDVHEVQVLMASTIGEIHGQQGTLMTGLQ